MPNEAGQLRRHQLLTDYAQTYQYMLISQAYAIIARRGAILPNSCQLFCCLSGSMPLCKGAENMNLSVLSGHDKTHRPTSARCVSAPRSVREANG